MTRRGAFIYEDALSRHVLREGHVFVPSRLRYTFDLLESYGAFRDDSSLLVVPRAATDDEVLSFHTPDYVAAVKSFSRGESLVDPARYNFSQYGDNPKYDGMYDAAALVVGGSLVASGLLLDGKVDAAFNSSGGLHHAAAGNASGFCVFNDAAIAIKYLVAEGLRVGYVDIDVHHGDGVQNAFYDTDSVLTISVHESGRFIFPGTGSVDEMGSGPGRGCAVNLPLAPYTNDVVYLEAFRQIVPPLIGAFKPDVLVTQLGIDTHFSDPLGHLNITSQGFVDAISVLGSLAPRWLALGGGGYDVGAVARCWTLAYGVMIGREWPDEVPDDYQERYGLTVLRDPDSPVLTEKQEEQARAFAQASVEEIKAKVFHIHGL